MIAGHDHVGEIAGDGFHLSHPLIPDAGVVDVHVVGHVADVEDGVEAAALDFLLQATQRLRVLQPKVPVDCEARRPGRTYKSRSRDTSLPQDLGQ